MSELQRIIDAAKRNMRRVQFVCKLLQTPRFTSLSSRESTTRIMTNVIKIFQSREIIVEH
ncbi:unnamed protein product [Schistosoma curassoni]|uniref:Transposase n=1 Tax=Schistosoma curassoni TaxID=6186 RepID=A0A183KZL1_9TREM|nr:unnamed protein product [Schistosoma curassoni]